MALKGLWLTLYRKTDKGNLKFVEGPYFAKYYINHGWASDVACNATFHPPAWGPTSFVLGASSSKHGTPARMEPLGEFTVDPGSPLTGYINMNINP